MEIKEYTVNCRGCWNIAVLGISTRRTTKSETVDPDDREDLYPYQVQRILRRHRDNILQNRVQFGPIEQNWIENLPVHGKEVCPDCGKEFFLPPSYRPTYSAKEEFRDARFRKMHENPINRFSFEVKKKG